MWMHGIKSNRKDKLVQDHLGGHRPPLAPSWARHWTQPMIKYNWVWVGLPSPLQWRKAPPSCTLHLISIKNRWFAEQPGCTSLFKEGIYVPSEASLALLSSSLVCIYTTNFFCTVVTGPLMHNNTDDSSLVESIWSVRLWNFWDRICNRARSFRSGNIKTPPPSPVIYSSGTLNSVVEALELSCRVKIMQFSLDAGTDKNYKIIIVFIYAFKTWWLSINYV